MESVTAGEGKTHAAGGQGMTDVARAGTRELDPGALAMQDAVRGVLDPLGVFNPGKG